MNRFIFALSFLFLAAIAQNACAALSRAEEQMERSDRILLNAARASASVRSFLEEAAPAATPKPAVKQSANATCGDPSKPCRHKEKTFAAWELSFQMPARLAPNKPYRSAPFFAVIVEKYDGGECDDSDANSAGEAQRLKLQQRFPARKVFAEYSCPNLSAVTYGFAGKSDETGEQFLYLDYIAVYAGASVEEANALRDELIKEFPNAEVKRMTARYEIIDQ